MKLDTAMSDMLVRGILSLILTFFLSVALSIHAESISISRWKGLVLQTLPIIFGALFYAGFTGSMDNTENILFFLLSLSGIIAYIYIAPYIRNLFSDEVPHSVYYTYFYRASVIFLVSSIFGGILSLLGSIGIGAVFSLFDVRDVLSEKLYQDWIILSLALFAPFFGLTQISEKESFWENRFNENVFFSFLVKFIAIPFIYLYFFILYAYSIKVLSHFGDWPKGEVSWMVIGFSTFGYIVYIFSYIFEEKNAFIRIFRKLFPWVVIPQLCMLFYAIYLRIAQYDITVNRYFVVVFGFWLAGISLYYIFSRSKHLSFIPFLLAVFSMIISIGPWSVYNLPLTRQLTRLEHTMERVGILKDKVIIPLKNIADISESDSRDIYASIEYICGFNDCRSIKELFPVQYADLEKKSKKLSENTATWYDYVSPSRWEIVQSITEAIKVQNFSTWIGESEQELLDFSLDYKQSFFPLDIHTYSQMIRIAEVGDDKESTNIFARYNFPSQTMEIVRDSQVVDTVSLRDFLSGLIRDDKHLGNTNMSKAALTYTTDKYIFLFERINTKNPKYTGKSVDKYMSVGGYVLVK